MGDTALLAFVAWWRSLSPHGRVRGAAAIALPGGGILAGYLLGMRRLRLLTLAYGRSHPAGVTGPTWLQDPLAHVWACMLAGAAVGALLAVTAERLARPGGHDEPLHAAR